MIKFISFLMFVMTSSTYANSISFHPSLMKSVENGSKTATIRALHRDYYEIGPAVAKARDGSKIDIIIEKVDLTYYLWADDAITSEVLRRENLSDTSEKGFLWLYEALKGYYPTFEIGDPVTIIYFRR